VGSGDMGEATAMCVGGGGITGTVGSGDIGDVRAACGGGGITGTVGSGDIGEATVATNNAAVKIAVQTLSDLEVIEVLLPWVKLRIKIVPQKW
jgi:hypothetical protein